MSVRLLLLTSLVVSLFLRTTYAWDKTQDVSYVYDQVGPGSSFGVGRLTGVTDAAGVLARRYDERGNLLAQARTAGAAGAARTTTTSYSYDAAGRVSGLVYPSGLSLGYARDALGRVTAISAGGTKVVSGAAYLPFGPLSGLVYGNGVVEALSHDASYRATGVADTGSAGLVSKRGYTLDAADNVLDVADGVVGSDGEGLTYDAADRLLTATGAYGALSWTYDGNGNRLTQALGANPADAYAYDGGQLTSVTPGSAALPAQDLRWNTPGVLELRTPVLAGNAGSASVFGQDAAGRMAGATVPGVGVESWAYDFAGRLFSRTVPGPPAVVTQLWYDRGGLLLEEDVNGAPQADYVYLPDDRGDGRPVAVYAPAGGTFSYLHDDRLGTPVKATSASQGTVWSAVYQPFGSATVTGSIRQNLRLPGQFAGSLTGWYHNGARDYEPQWGRYVEADPLDRPGGGANIVGYANQNPLRFIDPSGLAVGDYPPPPPGYDPTTWKQGVWGNGKTWLTDPSTGTTYTVHTEDQGHWRHWDMQNANGKQIGQCPSTSSKLSNKAPQTKQSSVDPNGDAAPWKSPQIPSNILPESTTQSEAPSTLPTIEGVPITEEPIGPIEFLP